MVTCQYNDSSDPSISRKGAHLRSVIFLCLSDYFLLLFVAAFFISGSRLSISVPLPGWRVSPWQKSPLTDSFTIYSGQDAQTFAKAIVSRLTASKWSESFRLWKSYKLWLYLSHLGCKVHLLWQILSHFRWQLLISIKLLVTEAWHF